MGSGEAADGVTNFPQSAIRLFRATITMIAEPMACEASFVVHAPSLCSHPKLAPPPPKEPQVISCVADRTSSLFTADVQVKDTPLADAPDVTDEDVRVGDIVIETDMPQRHRDDLDLLAGGKGKVIQELADGTFLVQLQNSGVESTIPPHWVRKDGVKPSAVDDGAMSCEVA